MDFDGTINMEDTFAGAMRLFVSPEDFAAYSKKLLAGEATLSQVVRRAYDGAPAALLPKFLDYVRSVPMRPGFDAFLGSSLMKSSHRILNVYLAFTPRNSKKRTESCTYRANLTTETSWSKRQPLWRCTTMTTPSASATG